MIIQTLFITCIYFSLCSHQSGKPKITKFDDSHFGDKNVLRLDISVYNLFKNKISDEFNNKTSLKWLTVAMPLITTSKRQD